MSIKPDAKCTPWEKETALDRICRCKGMLYVHGFITEAENNRIQQRLLKWAAKNRPESKEAR